MGDSAEILALTDEVDPGALNMIVKDTAELESAVEGLNSIAKRLADMAADTGTTGLSADAAEDEFVHFARLLAYRSESFAQTARMANAARSALTEAQREYRGLPDADIPWWQKSAIMGGSAVMGPFGMVTGNAAVNHLQDRQAQERERQARRALDGLNAAMHAATNHLPNVEVRDHEVGVRSEPTPDPGTTPIRPRPAPQWEGTRSGGMIGEGAGSIKNVVSSFGGVVSGFDPVTGGGGAPATTVGSGGAPGSGSTGVWEPLPGGSGSADGALDGIVGGGGSVGGYPGGAGGGSGVLGSAGGSSGLGGAGGAMAGGAAIGGAALGAIGLRGGSGLFGGPAPSIAGGAGAASGGAGGTGAAGGARGAAGSRAGLGGNLTGTTGTGGPSATGTGAAGMSGAAGRSTILGGPMAAAPGGAAGTGSGAGARSGLTRTPTSAGLVTGSGAGPSGATPGGGTRGGMAGAPMPMGGGAGGAQGGTRRRRSGAGGLLAPHFDFDDEVGRPDLGRGARAGSRDSLPTTPVKEPTTDDDAW